MEIRRAAERDYMQLAQMKWLHCQEDDIDYNEQNLVGVDKERFIQEFIDFLKEQKEYKIFVACEENVVASAMFVHMIPKVPKPNGNVKYIAYLTNVYTIKEYRNQQIGTKLLVYIKEYLAKEKCELIFAWPSDNSIEWYSKNGFCQENEIFECMIGEE